MKKIGLEFLKKPWRRWNGRALLGLGGAIATISIGSLASFGQPKNSPQIAATFLPIYMFTRAVGGENAEVEILITPGTSPHEYQATPANARAIAEADVLVKNGLGLEEFLDKLIAAAGNSQLKEIDSSQGIEPIEEEEHEEEHEEHHHHHHEGGNPHVWLDPVLAQQQVINIRDGLIDADPNNAEKYEANAAAYLQQLQELDREFQARLTPVAGCKFIAFHDAYPYLAKRYGLQQMAVVELPEDNIAPRDLQRIINTVQEFQVKGFLSERGTDDSRIKQISNDLGLPVKVLDPIVTGPLDPQHYLKAMRENLTALEEVCR
jgi:zinc/manganese transport system substrate-binding protein